jgi:hypothetical protein
MSPSFILCLGIVLQELFKRIEVKRDRKFSLPSHTAEVEGSNASSPIAKRDVVIPLTLWISIDPQKHKYFFSYVVMG